MINLALFSFFFNNKKKEKKNAVLLNYRNYLIKFNIPAINLLYFITLLLYLAYEADSPSFYCEGQVTVRASFRLRNQQICKLTVCSGCDALWACRSTIFGQQHVWWKWKSLGHTWVEWGSDAERTHTHTHSAHTALQSGCKERQEAARRENTAWTTKERRSHNTKMMIQKTPFRWKYEKTGNMKEFMNFRSLNAFRYNTAIRYTRY